MGVGVRGGWSCGGEMGLYLRMIIDSTIPGFYH